MPRCLPRTTPWFTWLRQSKKLAPTPPLSTSPPSSAAISNSSHRSRTTSSPNGFARSTLLTAVNTLSASSPIPTPSGTPCCATLSPPPCFLPASAPTSFLPKPAPCSTSASCPATPSTSWSLNSRNSSTIRISASKSSPTPAWPPRHLRSNLTSMPQSPKLLPRSFPAHRYCLFYPPAQRIPPSCGCTTC